MRELFTYNWTVRREWFDWCSHVPDKELFRERTGGMGSIFRNLVHVADCEQIWISQLNGTPERIKEVGGIQTMSELVNFSETVQADTIGFLESLENPRLDELFHYKTRKGTVYEFTYRKVLHHIITHEVHHIGQLSVWAREMGERPVPSDLLFK
ncbi:DinB family protein [Rossellomorea aquimaris]|uniref:DinB family protein n=1 Tax=Rossellomorea aquimaris TaxID=189382 RepID=UPI001CD659D6|nr:DinB family protein [Rossellomorea aquimaris]MCA1054058.1 DinB family protein [Rossellomorea aquimaris]